MENDKQFKEEEKEEGEGKRARTTVPFSRGCMLGDGSQGWVGVAQQPQYESWTPERELRPASESHQDSPVVWVGGREGQMEGREGGEATSI